MIGYVDIIIKNTVYSNSRTRVKSVCIVTCVHATPIVIAGGKRLGRNQREGTRGADPSETQLMMTRRRRQWKHMTSNPVVIVRFTPATTEGECSTTCTG
jgi:hypothetical protein